MINLSVYTFTLGLSQNSVSQSIFQFWPLQLKAALGGSECSLCQLEFSRTLGFYGLHRPIHQNWGFWPNLTRFCPNFCFMIFVLKCVTITWTTHRVHWKPTYDCISWRSDDYKNVFHKWNTGHEYSIHDMSIIVDSVQTNKYCVATSCFNYQNTVTNA